METRCKYCKYEKETVSQRGYKLMHCNYYDKAVWEVTECRSKERRKGTINNKLKTQINDMVLGDICQGIKEKKAVLINQGGKITVMPLQGKRILEMVHKAYLEKILDIKDETLNDIMIYTSYKIDTLTENEIATYIRTIKIQEDGYTKDDIILMLNKRIEELKRDRRASSDDGWKSFREVQRLTDENEKLKEKLEKTENKLKRILDIIKED